MQLLIVINSAYFQQHSYLHHLQILTRCQGINHQVVIALHRIRYLICFQEESYWEMVRLLDVDLMNVLDDEGFYVIRACVVVFVEDLIEFWDAFGLAHGELADGIKKKAQRCEALLLGGAETTVKDEANSIALLHRYFIPKVGNCHFTELLSCKECFPGLLLDAIRFEYLKCSLKIVSKRQQLEYFFAKHRLIQIVQHPAICPQLTASISQLLTQRLIEDNAKHRFHSLHQNIQDPIVGGSQQKHISFLLEPMRTLQVGQNHRKYIGDIGFRAISSYAYRIHQKCLALQLLLNQSINRHHILSKQLVKLANRCKPIISCSLKHCFLEIFRIAHQQAQTFPKSYPKRLPSSQQKHLQQIVTLLDRLSHYEACRIDKQLLLPFYRLALDLGREEFIDKFKHCSYDRMIDGMWIYFLLKLQFFHDLDIEAALLLQ